MDPADTRKIKRDYCEQLCICKFGNFDAMDQFFEKYQPPHLTQYEISNLNSPIISMQK